MSPASSDASMLAVAVPAPLRSTLLAVDSCTRQHANLLVPGQIVSGLVRVDGPYAGHRRSRCCAIRGCATSAPDEIHRGPASPLLQATSQSSVLAFPPCASSYLPPPPRASPDLSSAACPSCGPTVTRLPLRAVAIDRSLSSRGLPLHQLWCAPCLSRRQPQPPTFTSASSS
jgi:hypothetical protein